MSEPATETLKALQASIKALHSSLHPHLDTPLHETLGRLDKLEQAKLLTCLAYSIQQLLTVYQKLNNVDPETTGAATEAKRIHQYFGKIERAELKSEKRTSNMNIPAVDRFIKAALASGGSKGTHKRFDEDSEESSMDVSLKTDAADTSIPDLKEQKKMRKKQRELARKMKQSGSDQV